MKCTRSGVVDLSPGRDLALGFDVRITADTDGRTQLRLEVVRVLSDVVPETGHLGVRCPVEHRRALGGEPCDGMQVVRERVRPPVGRDVGHRLRP